MTELVFRLFKVMLFVGGLAGFVWFALAVPLGRLTLYGHIKAIGQTQESQHLVDGTRQKVDEVKREVGGKMFGGSAAGGDSKAHEARGRVPTDGKHKGKGPMAPAPTPPSPGSGAAPSRPGTSAEDLSDTDRRDMKRLLGSARK